MSVPLPGDVLLGKYRVERVLGEGGMGVVVAATHIGLDDRVAIKFLLPEALKHPQVVARFSREARAAVKIKGEHVCRVLDVGTTDDDQPYMIMEYLEGSDLAHTLQERGPLPIGEAVDYVLQACEALAEAHAAKIIHRDIKPANLFLVRRPDGSGSVKVLDFGISKAALRGDDTATDGALTATSAVMGSPLYMSPEQLRSSRDVDPRADVWSLGVVLYELLTGRPPFFAESVALLCVSILQEAAPSPASLRPELPPGLCTAVLRALSKEREERFSNVYELASALSPYGSDRAPISVAHAASALGLSRVAVPAGRGSGNVVPPPSEAAFAATAMQGKTQLDAASTLPSMSPENLQASRRSATPLVAGGVLIACVAAGGAWLATRGSAVAPTNASPPPPAASVAPETTAKKEPRPDEPHVVPVDPTAASASASARASASQVAPKAAGPASKAVVAPPPKKGGTPDIGY